MLSIERRALRIVVALVSMASIAGCRGSYGILSPATTSSQPALQTRPQHLKPLLFVGNFGGKGILGFSLTAKGNAKPSLDIHGSKTGFGHPDNVALDKVGHIYTTVNDLTIAVFAPKANGNAKPIRTIAGSNTQLELPIGVAVDSKGYPYVADCNAGNVKVSAPNAKGNVAPVRAMSILNGCPIEVAVDAHDDMYVTSGSGTISEYASYADGSGLLEIISENSQATCDGIRSIAVDSDGNIYAGNLTSTNICVFAPGGGGGSPPTRIIQGSKTHLGAPTGLAIDADNKLYVSICKDCFEGAGSDSILVFSPTAKGNAKPQAVIAGSNTKLDSPTDIAIRP